MTHRIHVTTLLTTLVLAPGACSTESSVDLGETKGGKLVDYAAQWEGYAEAYKFDEGTSDRIRITLDANGDGTLRIGDQALFAPATDFDVGYPVGDTTRLNPTSARDYPGRFRPGFAYPLHHARIEGGRLRLYVDTVEPFMAWCEGQAPFPVQGNPTLYQCMPTTGGTGYVEDAAVPGRCLQQTWTDDFKVLASEVPVDCGKVSLCLNFFRSSVCVCGAISCTGRQQAEATAAVELDAALEGAGTNMVGTLVVRDVADPPVVHDETRVTVRLTRQ